MSMPSLNGVPSLLRDLISQSNYSHTPLTPSAMRKWLREHPSKFRDKTSTMALLRYVISDGEYDDLPGLSPFLCKDRQCRALRSRSENDPEKFQESLYL